MPVKVFRWVNSACWAACAGSYACLAEAAIQQSHTDTCWIGAAGTSSAFPQKSAEVGDAFVRTGRNYLEAHYGLRLTMEELLNIMKILNKKLTTNGQLSRSIPSVREISQQISRVLFFLVGLSRDPKTEVTRLEEALQKLRKETQ